MENAEQAPQQTESDDLVEITDQVTLKAYLDPFHEFPEDHKGPKWTPVILRIAHPEDSSKFDVGLNLGPALSNKVSDCFNINNGILKED